MGSGDWNDGMNLVGSEGKGESVWLAWFLYENLQSVRRTGARSRRRSSLCRACAAQAEELRANIEAHAWDGDWYRRAYFDDGTPLGFFDQRGMPDRLHQPELGGDLRGRRPAARPSGHGGGGQTLGRPRRRAHQAARSALRQVALEPGYIKGYVPGVRENGGQYTHAAIWTAMAFAMHGRRRPGLGALLAC